MANDFVRDAKIGPRTVHSHAAFLFSHELKLVHSTIGTQSNYGRTVPTLLTEMFQNDFIETHCWIREAKRRRLLLRISIW